jgi:glycosyltransferase involved in cell wall biosynthesis
VYFVPFMVGGAEWYVHNISKRLVKMGHEVHVFTANKYLDQKAPDKEIIDGIVVHRFPMKLNLSYRLKVWNGLARAIASENFDVIHTYDYLQSHTRTAVRVAKKSGTPVSLTVFDIHSMIPRVWYKQLPTRFLEKLFAGDVLHSSKKVLVRAPTLIAPLKKFGISEDKIIVTPSGINEESLNMFNGKQFLKEHSIIGFPTILFFGRLNPLKGPQHLLNIAPSILKEFQDAAFVFVGPDQSGYIHDLQRQVSKLGLEKHVFFLGSIYDFQEKMKAYSSCDLFVLPTTFEGTSQAIFEAMSQAKPIVTTNVGGIPSQIENGKEGLLVPFDDESALRDAVLSLLRNKELAKKLGANARKKVESFTYPILAQNLSKIYEEMRTTLPEA